MQPGDRRPAAGHQAEPGFAGPLRRLCGDQGPGRRTVVQVDPLAVEPEHHVRVEHVRMERRRREVLRRPVRQKAPQRDQAGIVRVRQRLLVQRLEGRVLVGYAPPVAPGPAEDVGCLVPEEVGGDGGGSLDGPRHRQGLRPRLSLRLLQQGLDIDRLALRRQEDRIGDLLAGVVARRHGVARGKALIIAVERLQDGHALTSAAPSGGTAMTPSRMTARKKCGVMPFA